MNWKETAISFVLALMVLMLFWLFWEAALEPRYDLVRCVEHAMWATDLQECQGEYFAATGK